jgi:hypothetical protein
MPRSKLLNKVEAQKPRAYHGKPKPVKAYKQAKAVKNKAQPETPAQTAPSKEPAVNGVWFDPNEQFRTCKQDGNLLQQAIDNSWKVPQRAKDELPSLLHNCLTKLAEQAEDNPFAIPAVAKLATVELAMDAANRDEIKLALALKKDLRDEKELEHKLRQQNQPQVVNNNVNVASVGVGPVGAIAEMAALCQAVFQRVGLSEGGAIGSASDPANSADAPTGGIQSAVGRNQERPGEDFDAGGSNTGCLAGGIDPL